MMKFSHIICAASLLMAAAACTETTPHFTIEGEVTGAAGRKLYLESMATTPARTLDSIELNDKGAFSFEQPATKYPEFYRLRLEQGYINLSIDSTETVRVVANGAHFASDYSVEGSENCSILRDVSLRSNVLKRFFAETYQRLNEKEISQAESDSILTAKLTQYKNKVSSYVFENPQATAAYFVIYQRVFDYLVFNPLDAADLKLFGAVATQYDLRYPSWGRTKQLKELTLASMKQLNDTTTQSAPVSVEEIGLFEIELPNVNNKLMKLSDNMGKVVLLDFTAYRQEFSPAYNMELMSLYEKYNARGLEIFQVSLDNEYNFWQVAASNLPWITVRDARSLQSRYAATYNVTNLPTCFLINREGELVLRASSMEELEREIKRLL